MEVWLLFIWHTMAPLKKDHDRADMGLAFRKMDDIMRFRVPHIPHYVMFVVLELALHTEDPDGVVVSINIFLFPYLYPLVVLEAALLERRWDTVIGGFTLTSFSHTSMLMGWKKFSPITGWEKATPQMEARAVVCALFLVNIGYHPATFDMVTLIEETSRIAR